MVNLFFYAIFNDESINHNLTLLPDPKSTISRLHVYHGVPVGVKDDDLVSSCQVDAESAHSCSQQEEVVVIAMVERVDQLNSLFEIHITVHA